MGLARWKTGGNLFQHLNVPLCSFILLPTFFWLHCGSPTCHTLLQNKFVSACVLYQPQSRCLILRASLQWLHWNICSFPQAALCVRTICSSMNSQKVADPSENLYLLLYKPQCWYLLWCGHLPLHHLKRNLCSGIWTTSFLSLSDFCVHWVVSQTFFQILFLKTYTVFCFFQW